MTSKNIIADFVNKRLNDNVDCLRSTFQNTLDEFNNEWSKKKFKWFFKRYRQNKLMAEIVYRQPLYYIAEITQPTMEVNNNE